MRRVVNTGTLCAIAVEKHFVKIKRRNFIMDSEADIKAEITFLTSAEGGRTRPTYSGYRPAHLVKDNYLTTGMHDYEKDEVQPGETVIGTIRFLSPEAYPKSLWLEKIIPIQEGSRVVGFAKVIEIYNEILRND